MDTSYRQPQRPSFPQLQAEQSAASSVFNSSSSLSSMSTAGNSPDMSNVASRNSPAFSAAPLPSPTTEQTPYFGSIPSQMMSSHQQNHSQNMQQDRPMPPQRQTSSQFQGQKGGFGGAPETAPFLQDFNLLAEAAKRAQMAVLMRDFDEMEF